MSIFTKFGLAAAIAVGVGCGIASSSANPASAPLAPAAASNETETESPKGTQVAVFAGGCFWGVEAVFEHVKGVVDVKSGYSGGDRSTAEYETVSEGSSGHAESVRVVFDPTKVSYTQLLTVFFSVAHDPTELNRQGPDTGTQYRSAIFYANDEQKQLATQYIDSINKSKVFDKPVVTQVVPLVKFYEAEEYHQDYLRLHPNEAYIVINDQPKIVALKQKFPDLYK